MKQIISSGHRAGKTTANKAFIDELNWRTPQDRADTFTSQILFGVGYAREVDGVYVHVPYEEVHLAVGTEEGK